jgi:hypothetical protein
MHKYCPIAGTEATAACGSWHRPIDPSSFYNPRLKLQHITLVCAAEKKGDVSRQLQPFSEGPLSSGVTGSFSTSPDESNGEQDKEKDEEFDDPEASCDGMDSPVMEEEGLSFQTVDDTEDPSIVSTIEDLPSLREGLTKTDRYALNVAFCLKTMAKLARSLPKSQLDRIHTDPLMAEVVGIMDKNMHQFTAKPLAITLHSMATLYYVPGRY